MPENAADNTAPENPAVESACRDIDRYIAELSQPSLIEGQSLTPSQRLRLLANQRADAAYKAEPVTDEAAAPPKNEF